MKNILIIAVLLVETGLFAECVFKTEEKEATSTEIIKNVDDYAEKITVTVPAKKECYGFVDAGGSDRTNGKGACLATDAKSCCTEPCDESAKYKGGAILYFDDSCQIKGATTPPWYLFGEIYYARGTFYTIAAESAIYSCPDDSYTLVGSSCIREECPPGYSPSGDSCKKTYSYPYYLYSCDSNDVNLQGFGWELESPIENDGVVIDDDLSSVNDLSKSVYSHADTPLCLRKYQECSIDCEPPLVPDSSGKCVADYEAMCQYQGMEYNSTLNVCTKVNKCLHPEAYRLDDSEYCAMVPNCESSDGVCIQLPIKTCETDGFMFNYNYDICEMPTSCEDGEFVMSDGRCASIPFCDTGDSQTQDKCVKTVSYSGDCGGDKRDGNLCYVASSGDSSVTYSRPLQKSIVSGGYKEFGFDSILNTKCSDDSVDCKFRLAKIYVEGDGKSLCFEDFLGVSECISIDGDCSFYGSIESQDGIRQLLAQGNTITAFNFAKSGEALGTISSSCVVSGKVGAFFGDETNREIISVKGDGADFVFWDSYERGFIGSISILPAIPDSDIDEGFSYSEVEVMKLLNSGFIGFYSGNSQSTYAVYNGLISKQACQNLIDGSSFYIPLPINEEELSILEGLSLKGEANYNFNDGDLDSGTCVIKSDSAVSFKNQEYSIKSVVIPDSGSVFVCSPFKCKEHYCQYNSCPDLYIGDLYEQEYFDSIVGSQFPDAENSDVCTDAICDSNKPYFNYCGNAYGCDISEDIFQQEDGTCVKASCEENETLNPENAKCTYYGCKDAIEKDGKCYKTLY